MAHAPHAGDGGDSMNNTDTGQAVGGASRARVLRTAGLLAVAVLFVLAAAAIVPGAARAATYNTWTKQTSGTTSTLYSIYFTDANNGWLVGAAGVTRHTTNGGTTWTSADLGRRRTTLQSVSFTDANNGWSVGSGGVDLPHHQRRHDLDRADLGHHHDPVRRLLHRRQHGWVVGSGGVIRHTTNGGTTWTRRRRDDHEPVRRLLRQRQQRLGRGQPAASSATPRTAAPPGPHRRRGSRPRPCTASASPTRTTAGSWAAGGAIRHTTNGGTAWATQRPASA